MQLVSCRLVSLAALVGGRNVHVFAVFCHGAARKLDALIVQHCRNLIVSERVASIFFFNQLADLPL